MKKIYDIFKNKRNEDTPNELDEKKKKYFLISTLWVKNLINFLNKLFSIKDKDLNNGNTHSNNFDRMFDRNKILRQYFSEKEEESNEYINYGLYPGPINNFHIADFKDCLIDIEESEKYTNTYIRKGIKEDEDFFYISEKEWNLMKEIFDYNYEIERHTATINNNLLIEVNLKKMKILLINENMKNDHLSLLKPRYIQISKELTIKDLKHKILRCVKTQIVSKDETNGQDTMTDSEENMNTNEEFYNKHNVKIYLIPFGMKERKYEIFELIYSYKNGEKCYKIKADELLDDSIIIEVI